MQAAWNSGTWSPDQTCSVDLGLSATRTRSRTVTPLDDPNLQIPRQSEQMMITLRGGRGQMPAIGRFVPQPGSLDEALFLKLFPRVGALSGPPTFADVTDILWASSAFSFAFPPHLLRLTAGDFARGRRRPATPTAACSTTAPPAWPCACSAGAWAWRARPARTRATSCRTPTSLHGVRASRRRPRCAAPAHAAAVRRHLVGVRERLPRHRVHRRADERDRARADAVRGHRDPAAARAGRRRLPDGVPVVRRAGLPRVRLLHRHGRRLATAGFDVAGVPGHGGREPDADVHRGRA